MCLKERKGNPGSTIVPRGAETLEWQGYRFEIQDGRSVISALCGLKRLLVESGIVCRVDCHSNFMPDQSGLDRLSL